MQTPHCVERHCQGTEVVEEMPWPEASVTLPFPVT